MKVSFKKEFSEVAIYVIIWLFILTGPIFASSDHSENFSKFIIRDWARDIPIFILFIINTVWLVPNLLFKKKIGFYIGLVVLLSVVSAFISEPFFSVIHHFHYTSQGFNPPMPKLGSELPPPRGMFGFGFFNQIVLGLLVISLNTAIKVTIKWFKDEQTRREVEKEYLKSELTFLQNQVSPHFFMNTLNNIHALIDINGKDAQLAIVKLSKMMRYLLYESNHGSTTLKKELELLESFIDLMKLRVDETVRIKLSVPKRFRDVKIPPLLLIPFIENAFKHGISYQEKSYVNMSLEQIENSIIFNCSNSLITKKVQEYSASGIGLRNVKKRLDLLYGNTYDLFINESYTEFQVKLIIPVYGD